MRDARWRPLARCDALQPSVRLSDAFMLAAARLTITSCISIGCRFALLYSQLQENLLDSEELMQFSEFQREVVLKLRHRGPCVVHEGSITGAIFLNTKQ